MMTKLLTAALLGASAIVASVPAAAVTVVSSQDITNDLVIWPGIGAAVEFGNLPGGLTPPTGTFDFDDTFTFTYNWNGASSASASNTRLTVGVNLRDINFTSISFNGQVFTPSSLPADGGGVSNTGPVSMVYFENVDLVSGLQTLVIKGNSTGRTSYGGELSILNSVPEPATWALMILGFGLVGASMRNRRRGIVAA